LQRTQDDLESRSRRNQSLLAVLEQFERDVQWRASTEFSEQGWLFPAAATEAGGTVQTAPPLFLPPSVLLQRRGGDGWVLELVRAVEGQPGYWQRVQWWQAPDGLYRLAGPADWRYPLPAPEAQACGGAYAPGNPAPAGRCYPLKRQAPAVSLSVHWNLNWNWICAAGSGTQ